jgi:hypothetical protein
MITIESFKNSLQHNTPDPAYSPILKSLWYDGKDDWSKAHDQVDSLNGKDAAWVHAYLHRKEGDVWNADYWYTKAGKLRPEYSLDQEWELLVNAFLQNS